MKCNNRKGEKMRFIKLKEVMAKTSIRRSTIYKYMAEGRFPQSVPLGGRSVAWVESEVDEWLLERITERDESCSLV